MIAFYLVADNDEQAESIFSTRNAFDDNWIFTDKDEAARRLAAYQADGMLTRSSLFRVEIKAERVAE